MALNPDALDAVVMASGMNRIPLYDGYVPGYKALLPFHGKACIHYVMDALRGASAIQRICVVGPQSLLRDELAGRQSEGRYEFEDGGDSLLESVLAGMRHFEASPAVLVVTADLPLITTAAILDFIQSSALAQTGYEHNLYVSVAPQECYTGPYTKFTKPFNRFRDISLCHGNLFIADPQLINNQAAVDRINALYLGRKTAVTSALALGCDVALAYLVGVECLHVITLRQMADIASRHFGFGIVPVVLNHPEVTIDVDEPDDFEFVRRLLDKPQKFAATCTSR